MIATNVLALWNIPNVIIPIHSQKKFETFYTGGFFAVIMWIMVPMSKNLCLADLNSKDLKYFFICILKVFDRMDKGELAGFFLEVRDPVMEIMLHINTGKMTKTCD